jgi:hypothetical protein
MPLEPDAVLLGDLALEEVRLRHLGHDRLERRSVGGRARDEETPVRVVREHGIERNTLDGLVARRLTVRPEVGRDAPPLVANASHDPLAKRRRLKPRNIPERERASVPRTAGRARHEAPSNVVAAARTRS